MWRNVFLYKSFHETFRSVATILHNNKAQPDTKHNQTQSTIDTKHDESIFTISNFLNVLGL